MDSNLHFIRHEILNRYICEPPTVHLLVAAWLPDGSVSSGTYSAFNPKKPIKSPYPSLCVNLNTGRWHDIDTEDAGENMVSLCSYLFDLSQQKAALRIIETMRWSA
jgi:hypothetical protein